MSVKTERIKRLRELLQLARERGDVRSVRMTRRELVYVRTGKWPKW